MYNTALKRTGNKFQFSQINIESKDIADFVQKDLLFELFLQGFAPYYQIWGILISKSWLALDIYYKFRFEISVINSRG
jgi:hypothetical protein